MRRRGKGCLNRFCNFFSIVYHIWTSEYRAVLGNAEMLVFFFLLPLAYPILYALIYNPEAVTEVPVVVVDNDGTTLSRRLVSDFDATSAACVIGYRTDIMAARKAMMRRDCYAILVIPDGFQRDVTQGAMSGTVIFYTDMSLLLNYKTLYMALTNVTMAVGANMRQELLPIGVSQSMTDIASNPIPNASVVLYNPTSGLASFLIPSVLILILHQSIILGLAIRAGIARERNERLYGAPYVVAEMCGRALCYLSLYVLNVAYLTHVVPLIFKYPQIGHELDIMLFALPLVLSAIFLGMTLSVLVHEREEPYLMFVFTSVLLLFLSGIAWPWYAMPDVWRWIARLLPSTWGVKGFVQMNTMGASLSQVSDSYIALWLLACLYFMTAWFVLSRERNC